MIRLDKFISERTEYSRSRIKELCAKGQITVNNSVIKKSDAKINPDTDEVTVTGNRISSERFRYILLNKPEGYVCSTSEHDGETVMKLIPPEIRTKDMFPAGRLDKDSLGALLITNDGELAHHMLAPEKHIPKIYIVKLAEPFQIKYIDIFKKGVGLSSGEVCRPAMLQPAKTSEKLVFIEIHEGKYHQIKRMFAAVGNHVEKLMRVSVGGLILPEKLGTGQYMELLHKDVENIFNPPDFYGFCSNFSELFSANLINK